MNTPILKTQSGFALLIFLVVLMGMGGLLIVGFTQQVKKEVDVGRFKHNREVLEQAKQALLMYAYNYPEISLASGGFARGPGRLPCSDIDNDGEANTAFGDCIALGRLPWNEPGLNLEDLRDASGQRLWYAVSDRFATNVPGGNIINSDSFGNITVRDQSENIIYDGSVTVAGSGVAAVIIAPGAVTSRNGIAQDRSVIDDDPFDTTADDDPGVVNPINYLDLVAGGEDNADFIQDSATNGFVLGPVNGDTVNAVNDHVMIITAAEVIEVAEKAALQHHRDEIREYLANTGNVYPWLYNYVGVPDVTGLSSYFPADSNFAAEIAANLDNFGRVPSIFAEYFTETDSQPIESELSGTIVFSYPPTPATVSHSGGGGDFEFAGGTHTLNFQTTNILTGARFVDMSPTDNIGRLIATTPGEPTFSQTVYFWENQSSSNGFWTMCSPPADALDDCNRDSAGNPTGGANNFDSEILRITINLNLNPGNIFFDVDYVTDPIISGPNITAASATGHAQISATYDGAAVDTSALSLLSASYQIDDEYDAGDSTFVTSDSGTLDDITQLNFDSLTLALRYYPELPAWAFDNNWHNSIMMAYANNYRPDALGGPCAAGTNCIQINNLAGNNDDKIAILTQAGRHNWVDDGDNDFTNNLATIFDGENADIDDTDGTEYIFDRRAGDDVIMTINEL